MNKTGKVLAALVYGLGSVITIVLLVILLLRVNTVYNPDAMLPMLAHEAASTLLAFGFLPMVGACFLFCHVFNVFKSTHKIRNSILVFLPSFICFGNALFWFGLFVLSMLLNFVGCF